jgi:predicted PurR-regulated permease PerM
VELIFREIDGYVSSFVRGQFLVCTVLFALYALGLWIVGVDLWLLLAVITGFGNLVPYVGFLSGIVISSLMALVTFGDMLHVVYVWLVFAIVQALEGTIVTPRILGGSVGLSPLVIILALFAGGQLAGLLGIFLAVPAAAAFRVLVRHGYQSVMER